VYRIARLAGLGSDRLDGAARRLQRRGWLSITLALFTPGVRNAAVPACGLAGLSFGVFLPALLLASGLDLALHFAIGAAGGSLVGALGMNAVVIVVALVVLAIAGLAGGA
jgi:membrane protein DedA with SNARE-associated domain